MDDLGYVYDRDGNGRLLDNKLLQVKDAVEEYKYPGDLDNQEDLRNYHYDAIGNLTHDTKEGIDSVEWTVYGKIRGIHKTDGTQIVYAYGPSGNRASKTVNGLTTWYVRDAQGNVMGVYSSPPEGGGGYWREQHLYGSSRLGTWNPNVNLSNTNGTAAWDTTGKKSYELTNHLGNVMATISDKRLQHSTDGTAIDYFDADVQSAQEYYAFGSIIPGRTYLSPVGGVGGGYRYGFNGKENDNEVKKDQDGNPNVGTQQDYGMRIYDSLTGRFLSVDPLTAKYPWYTPYSFAGNMPIRFIDMDGLEQGPPKFFFDPMPYTGSKSDYLKVLPNAATGVVNGGISLLYMAGDAFSTSVTAFQTGQSPFSYKDVNHSIHQLKTQVSERLTDLKNTKVADFNKYITSPQGLQETAEIGASMYLMSRPVLRTSAPIIGETESIAAGNGVLRSFEDLMANPKAIWGKSADNISEILGDGWTKSKLNDGQGWKFTQDGKDGFVSFSEGSTRHGNSPYYKINSGKGKFKVVDENYKATSNDKSTIIKTDK